MFVQHPRVLACVQHRLAVPLADDTLLFETIFAPYICERSALCANQCFF
jgi:hypothetical protein